MNFASEQIDPLALGNPELLSHEGPGDPDVLLASLSRALPNWFIARTYFPLTFMRRTCRMSIRIGPRRLPPGWIAAQMTYGSVIARICNGIPGAKTREGVCGATRPNCSSSESTGAVRVTTQE